MKRAVVEIKLISPPKPIISPGSIVGLGRRNCRSASTTFREGFISFEKAMSSAGKLEHSANGSARPRILRQLLTVPPTAAASHKKIEFTPAVDQERV